jgi:hypothetical protein
MLEIVHENQPDYSHLSQEELERIVRRGLAAKASENQPTDAGS